MIMASARRRLFVARAKAGLGLVLLLGPMALVLVASVAGGRDRPAWWRAGHGESSCRTLRTKIACRCGCFRGESRFPSRRRRSSR